MTGTPTPRSWSLPTMSGTAAAAASVLTVTRTSSLPACASWATWIAVASASAVSVLVIDWTTIGCLLPTGMPPTSTVGVGRLVARGSVASRASVTAAAPLLADARDVEIGDPEQQREDDASAHQVGQALGLDADASTRDRLDQDHEHPPAVQRRERQDIHEREIGRQQAREEQRVNRAGLPEHLADADGNSDRPLNGWCLGGVRQDRTREVAQPAQDEAERSPGPVSCDRQGRYRVTAE